MKAMLTSSLGGSVRENGKRVPALLIQSNGLLENLKSLWPENPRVLIVCDDPADYERNDSICACLREALAMSALSVSGVRMCDDRNPDWDLEDVDVVILSGGHVPTQNRFLKRLHLKERLRCYGGIVVAWSAGSMNCAETVYAGPELEGEAIDPLFERWIPGLGLTDINIFPHFQSLRGDYLDGLRLIEDITFADSMGHEIIALNDGSYILLDDGQATLCGEVYRIQDGRLTQICADGESVRLR